MKMRWVRALGALGGAGLLAVGGLELAACSEGGTGFPTKHDASSNVDGGGDRDGGDNDGGPQGDAGDAATDCGTPLTLQPTPDAGALCPFMENNTKRNCATSEHCCVYAASASIPSTCTAGGTACQPQVDAGGADFECDEKSDCVDPSKPTCCLEGTAVLNAACPRNGFVAGIKRTYCSADPSCKAAGTDAGSVICGSSGDCEAGTCAPVTTKTKTLGVCAASP